jgi:hypothetical protein
VRCATRAGQSADAALHPNITSALEGSPLPFQLVENNKRTLSLIQRRSFTRGAVN